MVPIVLFSDDVSGNESKKWNSFDVWAMLLAGLPRSVNSQLENIHFLCASNRVGCLDLAKPLADDLLMLESEGIVTYDALYKEEVLVVAPVICAIADNPDITNHMGTSARMFCRMCHVRYRQQGGISGHSQFFRSLHVLEGCNFSESFQAYPVLSLPIPLCSRALCNEYTSEGPWKTTFRWNNLFVLTACP